MFTPPSQATMKVLLSLGLVASLSLSLQAQTIDDAIMLRGRELQTGNLYSHDSWDQYLGRHGQADQRQHRPDHNGRQRLVPPTTVLPIG